MRCVPCRWIRSWLQNRADERAIKKATVDLFNSRGNSPYALQVLIDHALGRREVVSDVVRHAAEVNLSRLKKEE